MPGCTGPGGQPEGRRTVWWRLLERVRHDPEYWEGLSMCAACRAWASPAQQAPAWVCFSMPPRGGSAGLVRVGGRVGGPGRKKRCVKGLLESVRCVCRGC